MKRKRIPLSASVALAPALVSRQRWELTAGRGVAVLRWWRNDRLQLQHRNRRVTDDAIEDEVGDEEMYDDEFDAE